MIIAVLSGKGGTGKTFVSVNLAVAAENCYYADCDVEEPDGNLFFKPQNVISSDVTVAVPQIDKNKCSGCRICVDFCAFNALAFVNKVILFETLCHSCGGCKILCPEQAIFERERVIGVITQGEHNGVNVVSGCLNTGEFTGVPIIKKIMAKMQKHPLVIVDCPPGSGCSVSESIKEADYCIMVAEPSLFGAHDMAMAYELVKIYKKPCGVIVNKDISADNAVEKYCNENNIKIIAKLPYSKQIALITSQGKIAAEEYADYKKIFKDILDSVYSKA